MSMTTVGSVSIILNMLLHVNDFCFKVFYVYISFKELF